MVIGGNLSIEGIFPGLASTGYMITSPDNPDYNCIAWAAGDNQVWWWPDSMDIGFWPEGIPREETQEAFIRAYSSIGYKLCNNDDFEKGYEKIAIYVDGQGKPTHAARQLSSGYWTSKLGGSNDISHTLIGLVGNVYGNVGLLMKRKIV